MNNNREATVSVVGHLYHLGTASSALSPDWVWRSSLTLRCGCHSSATRLQLVRPRWHPGSSSSWSWELHWHCPCHHPDLHPPCHHPACRLHWRPASGAHQRNQILVYSTRTLPPKQADAQSTCSHISHFSWCCFLLDGSLPVRNLYGMQSCLGINKKLPQTHFLVYIFNFHHIFITLFNMIFSKVLLLLTDM